VLDFGQVIPQGREFAQRRGNFGNDRSAFADHLLQVSRGVGGQNPAFVQDQLPEWAEPFAREGRVELEPALDQGDGFFAVRLRRLW
jgi:hypothetical protein